MVTTTETTMLLLGFLTIALSFSSLHGLPTDSCQPKNCIWRDWSDWGPCSQTCGTDGQTTRHREMLMPAQCGGHCPGKSEESKECNKRCCPKNCQFSEWSPWECVCDEMAASSSELCFRYRDRTTLQECGGFCLGTTVERKEGNLCCYRDCVLAPWSPWRDCDAQCEQQGVRSRTRGVAQHPRCGGKACPSDTYQEAACAGPCCSKDCLIGEWGEWGECSTNCGKGVESRTRLVQVGECGGKLCPQNTNPVETRPCEKHEHLDCKVKEITH